jgi:hypothetical protein
MALKKKKKKQISYYKSYPGSHYYTKQINPSTLECCRSHANGDFREPHVQ